jgi:hypothetical protein
MATYPGEHTPTMMNQKKGPEGWGESRHAPAAATADGQRDTIGAWSMYNLPQKYVDAEKVRVTVEGAKPRYVPFNRTCSILSVIFKIRKEQMRNLVSKDTDDSILSLAQLSDLYKVIRCDQVVLYILLYS